MERKEIALRASKLQTKEELLLLLNEIANDEFGGVRTIRFSLKQLNYFSNPNNERRRYRHFSIPKKSGGLRSISAPCKALRYMLHCVNLIYASIYSPSEYAMGFCEGRSVVDNAVCHIGQNYVFNTDLENFFPSIHQARVWKRLQLKPFNFCKPIANVLAGLCCIRNEKGDGTFEYVLPQGAPTSPIITNAICDKLDRDLAALARHFGLHYTRYADDITFSSMHNVYHNEGDFMKELHRIITQQGFRVNEKKTRLQKRGQRQEVTGLTVNSHVNTSKKYVAEIRNLLHIWEQYGYTDAYKSFYKHYKANKGYIKKGEPILENVLYGKLQYLRMVKGSKDSVYSALQTRYDMLASPLKAESRKKLDYLHSLSLEAFEEMTENGIEYVLSKKGNLYGKAIVAGKPIAISITRSAKTQLARQGIINEELWDAAIKKRAEKFATITRKPLFLVLTSTKGEAPFWMLTCDDPIYPKLNNSQFSKVLDVWQKKGVEAAIAEYNWYMVQKYGHMVVGGVILEGETS